MTMIVVHISSFSDRHTPKTARSKQDAWWVFFTTKAGSLQSRNRTEVIFINSWSLGCVCCEHPCLLGDRLSIISTCCFPCMEIVGPTSCTEFVPSSHHRSRDTLQPHRMRHECKTNPRDNMQTPTVEALPTHTASTGSRKLFRCNAMIPRSEKAISKGTNSSGKLIRCNAMIKAHRVVL